jgi:hypothetical protein
MNPNSGGAIEARSHEAPGDKKLFNGQGDVETATVDAHSEEAVLSDERDIAIAYTCYLDGGRHHFESLDIPRILPWYQPFYLWRSTR